MRDRTSLLRVDASKRRTIGDSVVVAGTGGQAGGVIGWRQPCRTMQLMQSIVGTSTTKEAAVTKARGRAAARWQRRRSAARSWVRWCSIWRPAGSGGLRCTPDGFLETNFAVRHQSSLTVSAGGAAELLGRRDSATRTAQRPAPVVGEPSRPRTHRRGRPGRLRRPPRLRLAYSSGLRCRCRASSSIRGVLTFAWQGRRPTRTEVALLIGRGRGQRLSVQRRQRGRRAAPTTAVASTPIPRAQQIIEECYGNEPLFARGTSRLGIWLGLAGQSRLDASRTRCRRCSRSTPASGWASRATRSITRAATMHRGHWTVLAGPVIPRRVSVPIHAVVLEGHRRFVHGETRELCATGYDVAGGLPARRGVRVRAAQDRCQAHCHRRRNAPACRCRSARGPGSVRRRRRRSAAPGRQGATTENTGRI